MVSWGAQSYKHAGIRRPSHLDAEQWYQRTAAAWNTEDSWLVPRPSIEYTHAALSIYIDVDVQYNVRLTHILDDIMHTWIIMNWSKTLAIACCSNWLHAEIPQQSSWCPWRSYASLVQSGRNNKGTTYVRDIPIVLVLVLKWLLYHFIFITHTCYLFTKWFHIFTHW